MAADKVKARKEHKCSKCKCKINEGDMYMRKSMSYGFNRHYGIKTCMKCYMAVQERCVHGIKLDKPCMGCCEEKSIKSDIPPQGRGDEKKHDNGKLMWDLLPYSQVKQIVDVLTFGCIKYGPNQWQEVKDGRNRYFAALMRHLTAWWEGEKVDPESGKHHLAHAGCCLLFLMWLDDKEEYIFSSGKKDPIPSKPGERRHMVEPVMIHCNNCDEEVSHHVVGKVSYKAYRCDECGCLNDTDIASGHP